MHRVIGSTATNFVKINSNWLPTPARFPLSANGFEPAKHLLAGFSNLEPPSVPQLVINMNIFESCK